jgi:hypothetical protein
MALGDTSKLAELLALVGNENIRAEYEALLIDRENLHRILAAADAVRHAAGNGHAAAQAPAATPPAGPAPGEAPRGKQPRPGAEAWNKLSLQRQIECLLEWLEFKRAHPEASTRNGEWHEHIAKWLGVYNGDLGRTLRAAIAHTSGSYRPAFAKRIERAFGEAAGPYLARLAKIPDPVPASKS